MKYAALPQLGSMCSRLVIGTMAFNFDDEERWWRLLDRFVELGGNCFDTAHSYYGGQSEKVIGRWMASRKNRDDMIVLTKGAHPKRDGLPRVYPEAIESDLQGSLESLQVDVIDLYILHRDDEDVPVGELVDCLNQQVEAGRIRAFGGSNWSVKRLEEANAYARANGLIEFAASSPNLSLAMANEPRWAGCVSVDLEDLAWYEESQMALFSWSAQAAGFFTGRYSPDDRSNADIVRVYYSEENWARFERARALGQAKGVDANQIALAYVLSQPFPTYALFGPITIEELESSVPGGDLELTIDEVRWLDGRSQTLPESVKGA